MQAVEVASEAIEVRSVLGVEHVEDGRSAGDDLPVARVFRIEHAQRVSFEAALRVVAERRAVRGQIGHESIAVARARTARTERVDVGRDARDPELAHQLDQHVDHLRIDRRS